MNSIARFAGTYRGTGSWHDAAGKSGHYSIQQTNIATGSGFEVTFSYRASGDDLDVFGSSSTNAEGLYTVWAEKLRRAS